jgi:hypothetical protein
MASELNIVVAVTRHDRQSGGEIANAFAGVGECTRLGAPPITVLPSGYLHRF